MNSPIWYNANHYYSNSSPLKNRRCVLTLFRREPLREPTGLGIIKVPRVVHSLEYIRGPDSGFPPIRENRENSEKNFQSVKSGKKRGFQRKSGKNVQIREILVDPVSSR